MEFTVRFRHTKRKFHPAPISTYQYLITGIEYLSAEKFTRLLISCCNKKRRKSVHGDSLPFIHVDDDELTKFAQKYIENNPTLFGKRVEYIKENEIYKENIVDDQDLIEKSWPLSEIDRVKFAWEIKAEKEKKRNEELIKEWLKQQPEENRILKEYCKIFEKQNIVPFFSLNMQQIDQIVKAYHNTEKKNFNEELSDALNKVFDEEYFKGLKKKFRENIADRKRYKISRDIITLHSKKKYHLTTPLALIQIEGIIREEKQNALGFSFPPYLGYFLERKYKTAPIEIFEIGLAIKKTINRIYQKKDPRKLNNDSDLFNRNLILHGIDLDYDDRFTSLQAILLLEYVVDKAQSNRRL
ncbi:hypothetical protein [Marispirochaeta aestuarii]|uniref:hypothetical protein n=1 Tax=Marispirochaeta aestuarii TaxID=1963862 RepID=UPI0029C62F04|nr:hypothetical protein [Marispirochaeta aestuarii]